MKNTIKDLIKKSLLKIDKNRDISVENIEVNICKDKKFGDFSSNISMKSSHLYNQKPRDLAAEIIAGIEENKNVSKIEIAGPGFINFFITKKTKFEIIEKILNEKNNFGKNKIGKNLKVLIEFVSANPTGPLHVGHGRGAAFGDCLSNLLKINGYEVFKEYYVNDAGKQIDILTLSVLQRYHELINDEYNFQYEDLYKGDYIWDIAAEVHRNFQETFLIRDLHTQKFNLVDDYISHVKNIISKERFNEIKNLSVKFIQDNIEKWKPFFQENMPKMGMLNWGVARMISPQGANWPNVSTWDMFDSIESLMKYRVGYPEMANVNPDGPAYNPTFWASRDIFEPIIFAFKEE